MNRIDKPARSGFGKGELTHSPDERVILRS